MNLDLRVPMGLLFLIVGVILTGFGFITRGNVAMYERSAGLDINLVWGAIMLVFGGVMFLLGRLSDKRLASAPAQVPPADTGRRGHH